MRAEEVGLYRSPSRAHDVARPAARGREGSLAVAASGTLLVLAAFSAVVTTVGDSARSFHGGVSSETWTLSAMSLGLATALLGVGALADNFGRRRVLGLSAAGLALTSVLGAVAPSMTALAVARVLQGVAGAGVVAASLASIGHAFPDGRARTQATAVWAAALGAGIALGPLAGGALAAGLGWRSSYWLQAAAAVALAFGSGSLAESRSGVARPLDLPGLVTLGAGMASLTAGLVEGRTDWSAPRTIGLLFGGAALLASFAAIELVRRRPMVQLRLFAEPSFVASITGALFTGLALIGLMSFSPTVMERGLHLGVVASAAVLAVWSGTSMVVSLGARRLPERLASPVRLAIGLTLSAAGEFALTRVGGGSSWAAVVPGLAVAGIGSGVANAALGRLAVESVPADSAGMGSGANNTARYLGGAAGVALVVAIASSHGAGGEGLVRGWDAAALVSAVLCLAGAVIAVACGMRARG